MLWSTSEQQYRMTNLNSSGVLLRVIGQWGDDTINGGWIKLHLAYLLLCLLAYYEKPYSRMNGDIKQIAVNHILMIHSWPTLLQFAKYYNVRLHKIMKSWQPQINYHMFVSHGPFN